MEFRILDAISGIKFLEDLGVLKYQFYLRPVTHFKT